MSYVIEFLGVTGAMCASFVAGWIVGPRVVTPLVMKVLEKIGLKAA